MSALDVLRNNAVWAPAPVEADEAREAVAAVAKLIEAAHRAEVAFNTVRGCYDRNPGNFAFAMRELDGDVEGLRSALAGIGGAA